MLIIWKKLALLCVRVRPSKVKKSQKNVYNWSVKSVISFLLFDFDSCFSFRSVQDSSLLPDALYLIVYIIYGKISSVSKSIFFIFYFFFFEKISFWCFLYFWANRKGGISAYAAICRWAEKKKKNIFRLCIYCNQPYNLGHHQWAERQIWPFHYKGKYSTFQIFFERRIFSHPDSVNGLNQRKRWFKHWAIWGCCVLAFASVS